MVEGEDLFKTALGSFWGANDDARLHVSHCVELMEALLHASGSTDSVRASALAHGCRALELDRSDGGGGASAGGAGSSSYGESNNSAAPTAESDSKKNRGESGFGDDYRAPCHSVALLGILLGLPEALGVGSNGVERSPAKKAKLGGSLAKGESSKALSAFSGSKASSNSHGGALAALEAIPRSLQRRCLKVRLPSYCP